MANEVMKARLHDVTLLNLFEDPKGTDGRSDRPRDGQTMKLAAGGMDGRSFRIVSSRQIQVRDKLMGATKKAAFDKCFNHEIS